MVGGAKMRDEVETPQVAHERLDVRSVERQRMKERCCAAFAAKFVSASLRRGCRRQDARIGTAPGNRTRAGRTTDIMEAIVYRRYGGPEVLERATLSSPTPRAGEVLVRNLATSINAADYRMMRANPFLARFAQGLFAPGRDKQVLGMDVAGVVDAVGPGVTALKVGDAVFGETFGGAFAEQVCLKVEWLAKKPDALRFEEVAAIPLAGITALQAVRERAKLQPGQTVLVQGAGGGVGTLVVQIARAYGATVTAVCGPSSAELVRSFGDVRVIDYTKEDWTQSAETFDAVIAVNGYHELPVYRAHLKPGGVYVMVGGDNRQIFDALLLGRLRFGRGYRFEVLTIDEALRAKDLAELAVLLEAGTLKPVIDRVVSFAELPEAMRYVEGGHVRGKVVVKIREAGADVVRA